MSPKFDLGQLVTWRRMGILLFHFAAAWKKKEALSFVVSPQVCFGWLAVWMYGSFVWVVWVPALLDLSSQAGKQSEIYTTSVIFLLMLVGFSVNREKLTNAFLIWFCCSLGKLRFPRGFENLWMPRDTVFGYVLVWFFSNLERQHCMNLHS